MLSLTITHVLIAVWAAAASVAVPVEAIGMAAAPPYKRAHLDERPFINRAAVIVCALIAPWPPIWNLMREG